MGEEVHSYLLPVPKLDVFRLLVPTSEDVSGNNTIKGATCAILNSIKSRLRGYFPSNPTLDDSSVSEDIKSPYVFSSFGPGCFDKSGFVEDSSLLMASPDDFGGSSSEGGGNFDWRVFESRFKKEVSDKYGFIDRYKKGIHKITECLSLYSKGGCLEQCGDKDVENLIQLCSGYLSVLSSELSSVGSGDGVLGISPELTSSVVGSCGKWSETKSVLGGCPIDISFDPLVCDVLGTNSVALCNVYSWEGGVGSNSPLVEFMVLNYNLACLYIVKALKCYRSGKPINIDDSSGMVVDPNSDLWEKLEANTISYEPNTKRDILNDLKDDKTWNFAGVSPPHNWIDSCVIPVPSEENTIFGKDKVFGTDLSGKCDTYNHSRWCDPKFFSENDVKMYDTTLYSENSAPTVPDPSMTPKKIATLFSPVTTNAKLALLNSLPKDQIKKYHNAKFSKPEQDRYAETIFSCHTNTSKRSSVTGTVRVMGYINVMSKGLYYLRKIENVLKVAGPEFVASCVNYRDSNEKDVPGTRGEAGDVAFCLSGPNVELLRVITEKLVKLTQLDLVRLTILKAGMDKHKKWMFYYSLLDNCGSPSPEEIQTIRKGASLQLDALRSGVFFKSGGSKMGIPWSEQSGSTPRANFKSSGTKVNFLSSDQRSKIGNGGRQLINSAKDGISSLLDELTEEIMEASPGGNGSTRGQSTQSTNYRNLGGLETQALRPLLSKNAVWSSLLSTNYFKFLNGYIELLHRHFLATHWALVVDPSNGFILDVAKAQDQLISLNSPIDFFHRCVHLSDLDIASSWHYFRDPEAYSLGNPDFTMLRENLPSGGMSRIQGGGEESSSRSPFVVLSASTFLTAKSCSYVKFFKNSLLSTASIIGYTCKSLSISQASSDDQLPDKLKAFSVRHNATRKKEADKYVSGEAMERHMKFELEALDFFSKTNYESIKMAVKSYSHPYKMELRSTNNKNKRQQQQGGMTFGTPFSVQSSPSFGGTTTTTNTHSRVSFGLDQRAPIIEAPQPNTKEAILQDLLESERERTYHLLSFLVKKVGLKKESTELMGMSIPIAGTLDVERLFSGPELFGAICDCVMRHYSMGGGFSELTKELEDRKRKVSLPYQTVSCTKKSWEGEMDLLIRQEISTEVLELVCLGWLKKLRSEIPQVRLR